MSIECVKRLTEYSGDVLTRYHAQCRRKQLGQVAGFSSDDVLMREYLVATDIRQVLTMLAAKPDTDEGKQ